MQYISNVCLATVITVQYVLLYGLYEYVREVDVRCSALQEAATATVTIAESTAESTGRRSRRDVNIAENTVMSSKAEGETEKVEFINPNFRPIVEKETNAKGGQQNGTKEEWYWLNAYSRIPVSIPHMRAHCNINIRSVLPILQRFY